MQELALDDLKVIRYKKDKTVIFSGLIFGTLIDIIRNEGFLPRLRKFVCFSKRREERFKDALLDSI